MDIDLLSKMVKELILDNDKVSLPGLGAFVAEVVPSTFSDKGYTVNPPYRRLSFRSNVEPDTLLAELYAESNGVETDMAGRIVSGFVAELAEVLKVRKTVVFPGLGRLRATKENNVFFVADEDLDIYPEGFGLEPVSLKTHQETKEEVVAAVEELKEALTGQMTGSVETDAAGDKPAGGASEDETVEDAEAGAEDAAGPEQGIRQPENGTGPETQAGAVPEPENIGGEKNDAEGENAVAGEDGHGQTDAEGGVEPGPEMEPAAGAEDVTVAGMSAAVEDSGMEQDGEGETEAGENESGVDMPESEWTEVWSEASLDRTGDMDGADSGQEVQPAGNALGQTDSAAGPACGNMPWRPAGKESPGDAVTMMPDAGDAVKPAGDRGVPDGGEAGGRKVRGTLRKVLPAVACIVGAAVVLLLLYMLLAQLCPDFINSILYDEGELEVLRYSRQ